MASPAAPLQAALDDMWLTIDNGGSPNIRELCRRFEGATRKTLGKYRIEGRRIARSRGCPRTPSYDIKRLKREAAVERRAEASRYQIVKAERDKQIQQLIGEKRKAEMQLVAERFKYQRLKAHLSVTHGQGRTQARKRETTPAADLPVPSAPISDPLPASEAVRATIVEPYSAVSTRTRSATRSTPTIQP